jgi:Icc-related predicted phosphoesterase
MRTLVVSDKVEAILYSGGIVDRFGDVELVISCGDLPFYYIEFIVSMLNKPTYFVFGNHGSEVQYHSGKGDSWQVASAPQGATNLHCRTAKVGPLLLAGLEGSMRYNNSSQSQYTDMEMWLNIRHLAPKLLYNRLRYGRWLDVLVTHSPPLGIHDKSDLAHTGFRSFLPFMRWFKPRYLLHGHIHLYRHNEVTETRYHHTEIINIYPYRVLDLEPQQLP